MGLLGPIATLGLSIGHTLVPCHNLPDVVHPSHAVEREGTSGVEEHEGGKEREQQDGGNHADSREGRRHQLLGVE